MSGCPDLELFGKEPYLKRFIYVLITEQHLHNRGMRQLLKLVFTWMVAGATLGHIIFNDKYMGAIVGHVLALMFGDETSEEVFSLVEDLQLIPVEQKYNVERQIVDLVGSDSVVALRKYLKAPNQYSELIGFLWSKVEKCPRDFSSYQTCIVTVAFAVCYFYDAFSYSHYF